MLNYRRVSPINHQLKPSIRCLVLSLNGLNVQIRYAQHRLRRSLSNDLPWDLPPKKCQFFTKTTGEFYGVSNIDVFYYQKIEESLWNEPLVSSDHYGKSPLFRAKPTNQLGLWAMSAMLVFQKVEDSVSFL